jgi:hypothetical protein
MRLKHIVAQANPAGNRIDLSWVNPEPSRFPGVRLVRREGTHPATPDDGQVVVEGINLHYGRNEDGEFLYAIKDDGLRGETVYYYTLFPFHSDPPEYQLDRANRVTGLVTAPYNMVGQMYALLPAIYYRYDTVTTQEVAAPQDVTLGQLRRFLELPGGELDRLYSLARSILNLHNRDQVDGRLLPLLAQWIAWKTDNRLEIEQQRNELRDAPALYRRIGLIPTVEATVKRISGWESRTKEFVHNVFRTNEPERLNLWLRKRTLTGDWMEADNPLSLDFAFEGRPAIASDNDGTIWLFYHTRRKGRWDIWFKTYHEATGWMPSQPLTNRRLTDKHPTAVVQDNTLWVFWNVYDETSQTWRIEFRTHTDGNWSPINPLKDTDTDPSMLQPERKRPWAVVDGEIPAGLWLFRLEKIGQRWQLRYNRHDGTGWELSTAAEFPLSGGGEDPRVENDIFTFFHPSAPAQPLWVFWARQGPTSEPGQTRWSIAYRVKASLDPMLDDWGDIQVLPKTFDDYHDREPAVMAESSGNLELFWSSNQDGSWSIRRATLDVATAAWEAAEALSAPPYSQRDPLPLLVGDETWLLYRDNQSLTYRSDVYRATETVDFRYAGSTTAHASNSARIALRGAFADLQTYTYDAGINGRRTNDDWYGRDTIGLYLTPDTMNAEDIANGIARLDRVLAEFMPLTDRAVYITRPDLHTEHIYTYGLPDAVPHFISDSYTDVFTPAPANSELAPGEDFSDDLDI